jgi:hypothetical protein
MCGILGSFFESQLTDQQVHSALSKMNKLKRQQRKH